VYVFVALTWLVPDRRIESKFKAEQHTLNREQPS
jgi:hypothetical protein